MRSTLVNTRILCDVDNENIHIDLHPEDKNLAGMLNVIKNFITDARKEGNVSFKRIYTELTGSEKHIGMRRGLVPIYLSAVLHEFKKEIVISDRFGQVSMNADTIEQINANPEMFKLAYIDWNPDKEAYLEALEDLFGDYSSNDTITTPYERVMVAMKRWYMALPKYSKNAKLLNGQKVTKEDKAFLQEMMKNAGGYDLIFNILPKIYGVDEPNKTLAERIESTKNYYDSALGYLKNELIKSMRSLFCSQGDLRCKNMSLASIIRDWCEKLDQAVFQQL
jgi:hypothetical protein